MREERRQIYKMFESTVLFNVNSCKLNLSFSNLCRCFFVFQSFQKRLEELQTPGGPLASKEKKM